MLRMYYVYTYNVKFLIWSYIDIDIDIEMLPNYVVLLSPQAAVQFPSLPPDHMISLSLSQHQLRLSEPPRSYSNT